MFTKIIRFAVVMAACALAACGGGDDSSPAPTSPAPMPPVAVTPEADVTFRQMESAYLAQPGQEVVATVFILECKGVTAEGYCPGSLTETGHYLLKSSVELADASFISSDGYELEGEFRSEGGGKYRFIPDDRTYVWRKDTLIVKVKVSPYARVGEHTLVMLEVGSPAPDKIVKVESAPATLTVFEAPGMAPMSIRASEAYQPVVYDDEGNPFVQYSITAECARGTECGAWISLGRVEVAPGSVATVCDQYGSCNVLEADEDSKIYLDVFVGWMYLSQQTYTIKFYPSSESLSDGALYGLFVEDIDAWVGYEPILPKLGTFTEPETGCTVVTPNRCKG